MEQGRVWAAVRTAAVTALVFLQSYWIPVLVLVPYLGGRLGIDLLLPFHCLVTTVYMAMTWLFQCCAPRVARAGLTAVAVAVVLLGGCSLCAPFAAVAVTGGVLYVVGSYWLNVMSHAALTSVDSDAYLIGLSLGFPCACIGTLALRGDIQGPVGAALGCVVAVVLWGLTRPYAAAVLGPYRSSPTPHELSATNPSSFVPFTNRFFVSLLLFQLVYSTLPESATGGTASMAMASLAVVAVVGVHWLLCKRRPDADYLFQTGSFFLVAGGTVALAYPMDSLGVAHGLVSCGTALAGLVLYWCAVMVLGRRNILLVLPTLSWGRAALSLGAVLGTEALRLVPPAVPGTTSIVTLVAFVLFVGYNLIALKRFDFGRLARQIRPVVLVDACDVASAAHSEKAKRHVTVAYKLTPRETEVSALLAHGRNCRYIENELGLTRNTVKSHIRSIYSKLGVHSQQELIDLYERAGGE